MASITKVTPSLDMVTAQYAQQITGLKAGAALEIAAACYIKTDGLVYPSDAVADHEHARCHGFTPRAVISGEPVTLFGKGARFTYGAGLTPGAQLFLGILGTGDLDDAATTGDAAGVAVCLNATDIVITNLQMVFS